MVTVGDPVSLDCKVTGSPQLKVKWMKNGKELQSIRQHKLSFDNNISSLKIQSAQGEDEGEYVFEVANHISSCSCTVKVIVLGWFKLVHINHIICKHVFAICKDVFNTLLTLLALFLW